MNIKNNKNMVMFLLALSIIICSFFIYKTAIATQDYKKKETTLKHILLIEQIDVIINHIELEKINTTIYLHRKDERTYGQVISSRKAVDQQLTGIFMILNENSSLSKHKHFFQETFNGLISIRKKIDEKLESDILKEYNQKIISALKRELNGYSMKFSSHYKNKVKTFQELMTIKENLNAETTFIAYLLTAKKAFSIEDLLVWEALVNADINPDFSALKDKKILKELTETINPIEFSSIKNKERAEIFNYIQDGEYAVSLDRWLSVSHNKIKKLSLAQNMLFIDMKSSLIKVIKQTVEDAKLLLMMSLFFFLLIMMLLYLNYNIRKNSKYLTNTLRDIEKELNEKQRLEIQEVIKKNDTLEIYKFLAHAIKEPSREKDNFLANMSHEIRTPLNGIIGFTNLLKEEELQETQLEFVNIIEESSHNLLHIVNDILDFSKVTSGKIEIETISFNFFEKFESTVDSYIIKATQKNIELGLFIDPTIPQKIMGDPTRISQVLLNLMSNAIKFTPEGGEIFISIEKVFQKNGQVGIRFTVKDSGIGIEEEKREKIFDAFSQADATTNRKFGGTGLGLSISSKFIEVMGGKLELKSKLNEGSSFFFTLTLEADSQENDKLSRYDAFTIGYLAKEHNLNEIDKNVKTYIEYLGAKFKLYDRDGLFKIKKLPDLLFVDEHYIDKEILKRLLRLDINVVLIGNAHSKIYADIPKNKFFKIINKPMNFSKSLTTLQQLSLKKSSVKDFFIKRRESFEGANILVAEDDIINQKLMINILKNLKVNVSVASNGQEAVELTKTNAYDIILMDIQMPIMTGLEASQKIIEEEKKFNKKHTPIIALTANNTEGNKKDYFDSGMDGYLQKPLDILALKNILNQHISTEKKIIIYKDCKVSGDIYQAVLNNLGYKVDLSYSEDEFRTKLLNRAYNFALFDMKSSHEEMVDFIKNRGVIPMALSEEKMNVEALETFLKGA